MWATDANSLEKFDLLGAIATLIQTVAPPADNAFKQTYSLAFNSKGRFWATDLEKGGVWEFEANETFSRRVLSS